ncbi:TPA: replication protein [Escherichia coli]
MSNLATVTHLRPSQRPVERRVAEVEDGYTRLANALYEELIGADLTKNQSKVAHAICRKTYGYPGMKQIGSELSGRIYDIAYETRYMSEETKKSLLREMKNLDTNNFVVKNAQPMLAKLRGEEWIH